MLYKIEIRDKQDQEVLYSDEIDVVEDESFKFQQQVYDKAYEVATAFDNSEIKEDDYVDYEIILIRCSDA